MMADVLNGNGRAHAAKGHAGKANVGQFEVGIDELMPSPLNPRKTFDAAELQQLADSLKSLGMCQPILVRRRPLILRVRTQKVGPEYEIADGERRFRASKLAKLQRVPIIVRELTDRQMLEIMIVSFEQRADVSPAEKAAGYQRLIDDHGASVEEIAAQVGRSASTIRGLLKLRQLPKVAAEALAAGEIPQSTAELIARVPGEETREHVTRLVLCGWRHGGACSPKDLKQCRGTNQPLSFRDTRDLIERNFMHELKGAVFATDDADLVPKAGSCVSCPMRTGNNPEEYPGARADVCTSPACFHQKEKAHGQRIVAEQRKAGKEVISGKAAADLFSGYNRGTLNYSADYVDLAVRCNDDNKGRNYRQLVGKALAEEVVIAIDPDGGVHELLPKRRAQKMLREQHKIGVAQPSRVKGNPEHRKEEERRKRDAEVWATVAMEAQALAAARASKLFADVYGRASPVVAQAILGGTSCPGGVEEVLKRRGLPHDRPDEQFRALLYGADFLKDLLSIWIEAAAADLTRGWDSSYSPGFRDGDRDAKAFWAGLDIDPWKLYKTALAKAPKGKKKAAADPDDAEDDEADHDLGEVDRDVGQAGSPSHDWRATRLDLVEVLDEPDVKLLHAQGVRNLGQVADKLAAGEYMGVKQKLVVKLQRHIEVVRSAGEVKPTAAERVAAGLKNRRCVDCARFDGDAGGVWEEHAEGVWTCGDCSAKLEAVP